MCRNPKDWFLRECGLKNDDLTSSNFGRGIIGRPVFFLIFKIIFLVYWLALWAWRIIDFHILAPAEKWELDKNYTRTREYPDYLTNWGDTLVMLYLLYSTVLAIRIFYLESRVSSGDTGKATMSFASGNGVKWYYFPAQILFEIAATTAILITILYFGIMGGGDMSDILAVHSHIMNTVVIFLELLFNRIPFRFFHFLFTMSVALMYVLGNWIGYKMDPARNGTYSNIMDWSDNQAGFFLGTIETMMLFSIGGTFVLHIILWGIVKLKFLCLRRYSTSTVRHEIALTESL